MDNEVSQNEHVRLVSGEIVDDTDFFLDLRSGLSLPGLVNILQQKSQPNIISVVKYNLTVGNNVQ